MRLLEGDLAVEDTDALVEVLDAVGAEHGCAVQAFDARLVAGRPHLESAVAHANRAVARDEAVARDRSVEILLYAAGRRQIRRALRLGVDEGAGPAVLLADADERVGAEPASAGGARDADAPSARGRPTEADGARDADAREASVLDALRERLSLEERPTLAETDADAVRAFFDVGEREWAATGAGLSRLIRERVALLDVEK